MHRHTGKTCRNIQHHAYVDRDLERVTEAGRDSQRNAGSCIEMHSKLDSKLDRQRQTETDRDRQRQSETEIHTEIHRGRDRFIQRGACRGKEIYA